jgi:Planctomycete cytochrome C
MRMRFVLVAVLVVASAAPTHADGPTGEQVEFFENSVRPLLSARCYSCHSQSAKKLKGGLSLDSREAALQRGRQRSGGGAAQDGLVCPACRMERVVMWWVCGGEESKRDPASAIFALEGGQSIGYSPFT